MTPIIIERKDGKGNWTDPKAYKSLKQCHQHNKDVMYGTVINYFCRNKQATEYMPPDKSYRITRGLEVDTEKYITVNGQKLKVF